MLSGMPRHNSDSLWKKNSTLPEAVDAGVAAGAVRRACARADARGQLPRGKECPSVNSFLNSPAW